MTKKNLGPGGKCVCPSCGAKVSHQRSIACDSTKCPNCGTTMERDDG